MSGDTKVLIVDDHEMVRAGLRAIIESTGRMKVVGEAADGEEAIRLAQRLEPDSGPDEIRERGIRLIRFMGSRRELRFADDRAREKLLLIGSVDGEAAEGEDSE